MEKEVWSLTVTVPSETEKARSTVPMKSAAGEKVQPLVASPVSDPVSVLTRETAVMERESPSMSE